MRAVVTRVSEASVSINGETVGSIGKGFLVLLGIHKDDREETAKSRDYYSMFCSDTDEQFTDCLLYGIAENDRMGSYFCF